MQVVELTREERFKRGKLPLAPVSCTSAALSSITTPLSALFPFTKVQKEITERLLIKLTYRKLRIKTEKNPVLQKRLKALNSKTLMTTHFVHVLNIPVEAYQFSAMCL